MHHRCMRYEICTVASNTAETISIGTILGGNMTHLCGLDGCDDRHQVALVSQPDERRRVEGEARRLGRVDGGDGGVQHIRTDLVELQDRCSQNQK